MKCERCGKPATVHTITNINGIATETHLCQECAGKQNIGAIFSVNDFFKAFLGGLGQNMIPQAGGVCNTCSTSLNEFSKTGLLGCGDCYNAYEDALIPVLEQTHGNSTHKEEEKEESEENKLRAKLNQAIKEENFELAAQLRDQINNLKNTEG